MSRMSGPVLGLGIATLLALVGAGVLIEWPGFRSKDVPRPDAAPSDSPLQAQPDAGSESPRERPESRTRRSEDDATVRSTSQPLLARANLGDLSAQAELCRQDIRSSDPQDVARAHLWCSVAAQAGDPPSERYYADLLREGEGVPRDEQAAREWYEKAVKHGDTGSLYVLGNILLGSNTPGDEARGLSLIQEAARKGDSRAIALLQRRGMTTEPRYEQPPDLPSR